MIQSKFLIRNKNSRAIKIYFDGFFFEYEKNNTSPFCFWI
jgi:hypothetical protein